ncbi:MAG: hypothetical protein ACP5Q5_02945, partial [Brevinematia bacterium]
VKPNRWVPTDKIQFRSKVKATMLADGDSLAYRLQKSILFKQHRSYTSFLPAFLCQTSLLAVILIY